MGNLRDIKQGVRSLLEDPEGYIAPDGDLIQKVNIVYKSVINYLANFGSPNIEKQVPLLNVAAGTTTFTPQQVNQPPSQRAGQTGSPLAGLLNPLLIEWKQAGQPENQYREARFVDEYLPHIVPGNYINGMGIFWTWRAWQIYITPLGFPADFMVTGEFKPAPLLKDEDVIAVHPAMDDYLTYATAALIGASRVNPSYIQTWTALADASRDDVAAWLVRKDQGGICRVGRMTGERRRWY